MRMFFFVVLFFFFLSFLLFHFSFMRLFFTVVFVRTNTGQQLVIKFWRFVGEVRICHEESCPGKIFKGVEEVLAI